MAVLMVLKDNVLPELYNVLLALSNVLLAVDANVLVDNVLVSVAILEGVASVNEVVI